MKPLAILFLVGVGSLLASEFPQADAVTIRNTDDISNTRSYTKITQMITSIERDVRKDLSTLKTQMNKDEQTKKSYESKVRSYSASMTNFKKHLRNAQTSYKQFNDLMRAKSTEAAHLLDSLARQRKFIKEERRYIDHMENESLRLKKFSPRYKAIRLEIRQMRVQVNKEIEDVERAYRLAQTKISSEKAGAQKNRDRQGSEATRYTKLVAQYTTLHRTYSSLISRLMAQGHGNKQLLKELNDQLDLLEEIRTILATFKPGQDSTDKYKGKFETCTQEFRVFRNKYKNMNCTAI
jgi:chromosome segregation ATPase